MTEEIANHSEESVEIEKDAESEALFAEFGIQKTQEKKEIEFPTMDEPNDALTTENQEESNAESKRTFKYKYNGEEGEVDEEEAPTWIQKGKNYDKVQQKLVEQEKALDEVAQLQGYKDHAELLAELPKLREQQQEKAKNAHSEMMQTLRTQAEDAGIDPDHVENYLNNHPLVKQAQEAIAEREALRVEQEKQTLQQTINANWQELYTAFPDLVEDSQAFTKGENPKFYTDAMKSMVEQGYKPIDAFKLAHMDKIQASSRKSSEQRLLKEQQLGLRGHVNEQTATLPDDGSLTPVQHSLAEEFGVDIKGVMKQAQLLKNRR